MSHITVVPATLQHALDVAANLRHSDLQEMIALTPEPPEAVLRSSFENSVVAWAGTVGERTALVFGVGWATPDIGSVWMLGTPLVEKHRHSFLKQCLGYVEAMNLLFPTLANVADQRNVKTLAWLKWLGFQLHDPIPTGRFNLPFIPFTRQLCAVQ